MKFILLISLIISLVINPEPYLFKNFNNLKNKVPHISLCDLPTPISRLLNLEKFLGVKNIFIKRDDLSGKKLTNVFRMYGGNKPRKLEFLLADAIEKNANNIITYGCVGSNHALATCIYSNFLGLKSILMLKDQPNSHFVRENLLLDLYYGAQLKFFANNETRQIEAQEILKKDKHSYLIPTGGSNELGTLGYVNAAFELAHQIKNGEINEPDFIYVATGTCATTAGLLLGIKAANIKSKIVSVCIEPKETYLEDIKNLFVRTSNMLNSFDENFTIFEFPENDLIINNKFWGTEYGLFTSESIESIKILKETENIILEGTYSAKAVSAIIDDAKKGLLTDKTILFWNTYCAIDYSYLTKFQDYKKLPKEFHKYFEEDVQFFDKKS